MSDTQVLYHQILGDDTADAASKPYFVILHGLFGSSPNFTSLAKALSVHYKVIRFDLPNHGRSYHSNTHNYAQMAQAVVDSLAALQVEECVLLGHSMGGKVAIELAATIPAQILKLIVVDIAPFANPLDAHNTVLDALNGLPVDTISSRQQADEFMAKWIDEPSLRQFLLSNLQRDDGKFVWRINLPVLTQEYPFIAAAPSLPQAFSAPTLFLRGGASDYITDQHWQNIQAYFTDVQLATIEGAGHWLHAEKPREFYQALQDFLGIS